MPSRVMAACVAGMPTFSCPELWQDCKLALGSDADDSEMCTVLTSDCQQKSACPLDREGHTGEDCDPISELGSTKLGAAGYSKVGCGVGATHVCSPNLARHQTAAA